MLVLNGGGDGEETYSLELQERSAKMAWQGLEFGSFVLVFLHFMNLWDKKSMHRLKIQHLLHFTVYQPLQSFAILEPVV